MLSSAASIGLYALVAIVVFLGAGVALARLYKRASKEIALVRTGIGGEKVIVDGGAFVLPLYQKVTEVNLRTLPLDVKREGDDALITKDPMRVDVRADFYVRVGSDEKSISDAARTLGGRTMDPGALKELVEAKFVDALRAVGAGMTLLELHESRAAFVQKVKDAIDSDLKKNGLELESVSLTALDQTPMSKLKEDNLFDAQGLTTLKRETEERRKQRNAIERQTDVEIKQQNLEAERKSLDIRRETELATLDQERDISRRRAAQQAEIAKDAAEGRRLAAEADIEASRQVAIAREDAGLIEDEAKIKRKRAIEIAEQERQIAVASKSQEESRAQAEADKERANAASAEESVITVRQVAEANRVKEVALVKALEEAEREAIGVKVAADAEKAAAEDGAEAARIAAKGRADAILLEADARERSNEVDAKGAEEMNAALNMLSSDQVRLKLHLELVRTLPSIIEQQVKPIQSIKDVRVLDARGLLGDGSGSSSGAGTGGGNSLTDDMVEGVLRYQAKSPMLAMLLKDLGLDPSKPLSEALTVLQDSAPEEESANKTPNFEPEEGSEA